MQAAAVLSRSPSAHDEQQFLMGLNYFCPVHGTPYFRRYIGREEQEMTLLRLLTPPEIADQVMRYRPQTTNEELSATIDLCCAAGLGTNTGPYLVEYHGLRSRHSQQAIASLVDAAVKWAAHDRRYGDWDNSGPGVL